MLLLYNLGHLGWGFYRSVELSDLGHVVSDMFCQTSLVCVSFVASVALEGFHPGVRPHVLLQITRRRASIVALVTLERLFSCVHHHHVNFQLIRSNAGIFALCASVRLFPRVGSFVLLQIA